MLLKKENKIEKALKSRYILEKKNALYSLPFSLYYEIITSYTNNKRKKYCPINSFEINKLTIKIIISVI